MENAVSLVENTSREEARTLAVGVLIAVHRGPSRCALSRVEREAISSLGENEHIVILPADQGNATVHLDKADYEKILLLLEHRETNVRLKNDPTFNLERKCHKLLAEVLQSVPPDHKVQRIYRVFHFA